MKRLLPILAFLLAACIAPASADPTPECYMPSPLDEFANSPRRFRNDDGSEFVSSSLAKLGPGLVASRANGAPGETTFVTIDAPGVAHGGKWLIEPTITTLGIHNAAMGEFVRVDIAMGALDSVTIVLPTPGPNDKGRSVSIRDLDDTHLGTVLVASGGPNIEPYGVVAYPFTGAGNGRTFVWDGVQWVAEGSQ